MRSGAAEAYGQYFKEEVRRLLVERFGWERVYQGGLKVYTTVDLDMQKAAEAEVARGIADIEKRQRRKNDDASESAAGSARRDRIRAPAKCGRWSAAATSSRATSTARRRRRGSLAPRSSHSSTRRRSSRVFTPASVIDESRRADHDAAGRVGP